MGKKEFKTGSEIFDGNRVGLISFKYPVNRMYYRRISKFFTPSRKRYVLEVDYEKANEASKQYLYLLENKVNNKSFCDKEWAAEPFHSIQHFR